jgi:DNA polymerase III subunit epsilon
MSETERDLKIKALLKNLLATPEGAALVSAGLDEAGFKAFRRIEATAFPEVGDPDRLARARTGVILDSETTGVDVTRDEVIQLSMLKFAYDDEGILSLGEMFDRYRDPGAPITSEITAITGITNEMVQGKSIETREIVDFLKGVDIAVAHNAGFDRKMVERCFPGAGFDDIGWHCSFAQIKWSERGANGRSLELLALNQGYVFGAHNAANDIRATAFVLDGRDADGRTAFSEMTGSGARDMIMVIAKNSPFEAKDDLKARGFSWSPEGLESAGHAKVWYAIVEDDMDALADLGQFLAKEVYRRDVSLPAFRIGPEEKYSARKPRREELFRTAEVVRVRDAFRQSAPETPPQAAFGF